MGSSPPNKPPKQPRKVSRIFTFLKPTKREERQLEPSMPEQQTVDKSEHGNIATIVEAVLESNPSGSRDVTKMTGSPELGLLSQQSTGISVKAVVDDARDTSLLPSTNDEVEQPLRCLRPEEYTIGWLCPLEIEIRAALAMLDETHQSLKTQPSGDKNSYHLGRIGGHNVVIVRPYKTGNVSAAMTITSMRTTFTRVGDLLLVGIGGGVPSTPSSDSAFGRVRLGDVVVGTRDDKVPGAIQYDNGKAVDGKFVCTDYLRDPSERFQIALQHLALKREEALQAPRRSDPLQQNLQRLMAVHVQKRWRKKFGFPGRSKDLLFSSTSTHIELAPKQPICDKCDRGALIKQKYDDDEYDPHDVEVQDDYITVHRGIVASGGVIFKDAAQRDAMVKNLGVKNILCFDTEAAGAVMGLPGLVIRGISDYCDAHKPKEDVWHGYAAATAAAYARQLLLYTPAMSGEYIPKSFVETYQEDVANKDLSALYKWLDLPHPLNASNQHKFLREERVNGTGYHFLRNTQFTKWMDFGDVDWAERLLFCFGEPGAGKSFICSLVIDELHDRSDKPLIAYMYCNYRERRKQNIVAILGNLILQLLRACDDSSTDSVRHYMLEWHKLQRRKYVKLESMMFTDVLLVLWEVLTRTSKRVFFCVDALDECDHETQIGLLKALTTVVQASNVAIFVTSRPTLRQLVLNHFGVGRSLNFLQLRAAREDIELYVNVRIDADPLKGYNPRPMDDNLRMEILEKLVSNAEGIFLLPALQIASILEGVNIRQRRKLLKETSNTLTDTFTIMMERVKSQNPQLVALATQTLQWLTLGREILKVEDLQNALAIDSKLSRSCRC
ncbi:purine and uridine phosphorylase [Ascobolus immersus RN42]|uniref:Purine and uridine phosphorylase n=1 Tax=Ascobolus immersus RN42 TaxID=1160509 RepID=A0A3N4HWX9_ASCIM|nr:purine and uridine phosphorylase [Ascobolus immersus RN42]